MAKVILSSFKKDNQELFLKNNLKKKSCFIAACVFIPEQGHTDADMFFYLLIVFSTISSLYTLIWDLRMDWGLFDRGAGENTFLREEIVYPHKVNLIRMPCTSCVYRQTLLPLILSPLCAGLLLLRDHRRRDPALCLDNPGLSHHNDQDPLYW